MRVTLQELETHWSLDDVLDAHLAIQVHEQAERIARQRLEQQLDASRRIPRHR